MHNVTWRESQATRRSRHPITVYLITNDAVDASLENDLITVPAQNFVIPDTERVLWMPLLTQTSMNFIKKLAHHAQNGDAKRSPFKTVIYAL